MSITDRAIIRAEISALFDSIAAVEENLPYPPLALEGKSPVLYLHTNGTLPIMLSRHANQVDHQFIITVAINRQRHGADEAENVLDEVWTAVTQAIRTTPTGDSYMSLVMDDQRSQPYFATVDGIAYRFEELYVTARSNITG